MKTCRRCGETKPAALFGRKDRVCKACWAAYKKEQYRNEPRVRELFIARMTRPEGRAVHLLNAAKTRSKTYKLDFSLTAELVIAALKKGVCPKTGLPFDLSSPAKSTRYHPMSPSLDRIDKTKGYTPDNVQVVCNWYNIAKNEFTEEQTLALCRAVVSTAARG